MKTLTVLLVIAVAGVLIDVLVIGLDAAIAWAQRDRRPRVPAVRVVRRRA